MKISGHNTLRLMAGLVSLLALSSCLQDNDFGGSGFLPGDEAQVKFSIRLPGNASSTRALSVADENTVQTVDILVFGANGGDYICAASCNGTDISTDSGDSRKKTFTAKLRVGSCDLVLLANAADIVSSTGMFGKSKSQVLGALTASMPSGGKWIADNSATGYTGIPMWGELGNVTITEGSEITDADGLALTRMVARVDVKVSGTAASNFVIKSVDLYNYNTAGTLVPASSGWNAAAGKATAPNVPASSTLTLGPVNYKNAEIDATNNRCQQEIYMFEAENHTYAGHAAAKANDDRTCLVVGGIYGSDTNPSYYRVDFSTGSGVSETFLDVLRNHHYAVDITEVAGSGYDTSIDAFRGSVRLTAKVTAWDLAAQNVIGDGQYYLNVSRDEYRFANTGGSTTITAETDYNITTQGFPSGLQFSQAEIVYTPAGGDWLTLSGTAGASSSTITATASANATPALRLAKIYVKAGNFSKVINVMQFPTVDGAGTLPTGINTYVGAFWKADQSGERVIKIDVGTTTGNLGAWSAYVYWTSGDWNPGDIVLAAGYGGSQSILYTANPGDAESYPVSGNATYVSGTAASGGSIVFRIGLKSKWNGQAGYDPGTKPARYAVVALSYNNNSKTQLLFLRQGHEPDYLMRPGDKDGSNNAVGGADDRSYAKRFSPYNLTDPNIGAGGNALANHNQLAERGGAFVDFPTQAGAFFQWANTGEPRRAYHPANPTNNLISSWPANASPTYWNSTTSALNETCPSAYRRPQDGDTTTAHNTAGVVAGSEMAQSLWLTPGARFMTFEAIDTANSVWGYYADGFFDRRTTSKQAAYSSDATANSAVATNSSTVAYMGRLFYNPNNNASLFFPASGSRNTSNGYLCDPGRYGVYWSSSSDSSSGGIAICVGSDIAYRYGNASRRGAFSVRCVVE